MSKKQRKVRLTEENAEAYDNYSQETGSKTALVNTMFDLLRQCDSVEEFEEVVQNNSTGDSDGIVLSESNQVAQMEPGHGIPLSLDEALDMQIATEAKERVSILEAVIIGESDTHISESEIDYIIDQLFFNPADSTRKKYKTILLNKTGINALPGSDPRIMEPVDQYHVAAVESDPDKFTHASEIPKDSDRSFVNDMHVSDALYHVWEDIGTGYITDRDVWLNELYNLTVSVMRATAHLGDSDYYPCNAGTRYSRDGRIAALQVLTDRLYRVLSRDTDVDVVLPSMFNAMRAEGHARLNPNLDVLEKAFFGDVTDEEVEEAMNVLDVESTDRDTVINAFRSLVRDAHPDQGGDEESFKQVVEAKEVLVKA